MKFIEKWEFVDSIGSGGQGDVSIVYSKEQFDIEGKIFDELSKSLEAIKQLKDNPKRGKPDINNWVKMFGDNVFKLSEIKNPRNLFALKKLKDVKLARDPERAELRIKKEIEIMAKINHPNLLKIIDFDLDDKWFVSPYYQKGSLEKNFHLFQGNFLKALWAIRPLVEGVGLLHKSSPTCIHRDIKPQNIFLDNNNNLILGDFGLVHYYDADFDRISGMSSNVGTRDFMPLFYQGEKEEIIKPIFDVFSLGKVLWCMVSGKLFMRAHYFDDDKFNLEKICPNTPYIKFANKLFKKVIVERENDCLENADQFLIEIDKILKLINVDGDELGDNNERKCKICGNGVYILIINNDDTRNYPSHIRNFGLNPAGTAFKIFSCSYCGHIQYFAFRHGTVPEAWKES